MRAWDSHRGLKVAGLLALIGAGAAVALINWRGAALEETPPAAGAADAARRPLLPVERVMPLPHAEVRVAVEGVAPVVPAPIRPLDLVLDTRASMARRLDAVGKLGGHLREDEIAALVDYLRSPVPAAIATAERAIRNDVLNVLWTQPLPVARMTEVLSNLYLEKSTDPVMRDYALQHLSLWREKVAEAEPVAAQRVDETLWQAAADASSTYAGTALLALSRVMEEGVEPNDEQVARLQAAASRAAGDPGTALPSRVTATELLGRLGVKDAEQALAPLLADADAPPMLRLAAIGACSHLAEHSLPPALVASLTSLSQSEDSRLRHAASLALGRHAHHQTHTP